MMLPLSTIESPPTTQQLLQKEGDLSVPACYCLRSKDSMTGGSRKQGW